NRGNDCSCYCVDHAPFPICKTRTVPDAGGLPDGAVTGTRADLCNLDRVRYSSKIDGNCAWNLLPCRRQHKRRSRRCGTRPRQPPQDDGSVKSPDFSLSPSSCFSSILLLRT